MNTSKQSTTAEDASYSKMSVGDVEAIGSHCQMPFCHQLDFLPFKCESCKGKFCLDHRTESSHQCPHAGEWARRRAQQQQQSASTSARTPTTSRPNILTHEQQCSHPSCKTLINTPLSTGVHCSTCNRSYCLKHRFDYEHACKNLVPLGARPSEKSTQQTQREKGLEALSKLRAWGASKKSSVPSLPASKSKTTALAQTQALATLKRTAKGDASIPVEKRIYLHVEASSATVSSKIPKGEFFYSTDFTVGRVLDLAAKSLAVANVNNRREGEEEKLRVFHVDGGRLLEFGEKLGLAVGMGDTIVLIRGVGDGMARVP